MSERLIAVVSEPASAIDSVAFFQFPLAQAFLLLAQFDRSCEVLILVLQYNTTSILFALFYFIFVFLAN